LYFVDHARCTANVVVVRRVVAVAVVVVAVAVVAAAVAVAVAAAAADSTTYVDGAATN
jgi:hypothetical protein